jgi:hypothetical protein
MRIRNTNLLSCGQCIFSFYEVTDKHSTMSKCRLFGEKCLMKGHIVHDFTVECRKDENKCGNQAKFFRLKV